MSKTVFIDVYVNNGALYDEKRKAKLLWVV